MDQRHLIYLDNNSTTLQPGEYRLYSTQPIHGLVTNVEDEQGAIDAAIKVYPQPASDQLTITLPQATGLLRIIDTMGRTVLEQKISEFDSTTFMVGSSTLGSGKYVVKYITPTNTHTTSFVIQR